MKKKKNNQENSTSKTELATKVRLDKWLWATRFYKTRGLASDAIKGGKIHINKGRIKASYLVNVGDTVRIRKNHIETTIVVLLVSDKRGSAPIAQTLYDETLESLEKRTIESKQRRELFLSNPMPERRPNKKQRRNIIKFKQDFNDT